MYVDVSIRKELSETRKRFEEAIAAFGSLQETLEVLADKKLVAGLRTSERDYRSGRFHSISELTA